jgi:hypothetical protein
MNVNPANISGASCSGDFTTYMLYRPSGSESEWVPLALLNWDYSVRVISNGVSLIPQLHTQYNDPNFASSSTYPIWDRVVSIKGWQPD